MKDLGLCVTSVFHGDKVAMVTTYLGLRITPQKGFEFGPGFHGYNRAWFVREVTTQVAMVTIKGVALR
jgi:hypothetical protein